VSNCKTIAICNQKGGVMGVQNDCLYSDTDYTEWYVDKYGDLRADESARKDDSVRAMLRIEPKPRRNAGRRMTVISTLSVCANNAAKSFIQTAQGRGFAILTVQKPISKPKKRRNALPKRESTPFSKGLQDLRQALLAVQRSGGAVLRGMQNHQPQAETTCLLLP